MVITIFSLLSLLYIDPSPFYTFSQDENNYTTGVSTETPKNTGLQLPATMGVKIASPAADERVPIEQGKNLKVVGTSTDNTNTDCQVSVTLNDVKPYQNVIPTGPNGKDDYSTWSYFLTPGYNASINEGTNKITSKLSCTKPSNNSVGGNNSSNPSLATHYSVFFKASISSSMPASIITNNNNNNNTNNNNNNTISTSLLMGNQLSQSLSSPLSSQSHPKNNASNIAPLDSTADSNSINSSQKIPSKPSLIDTQNISKPLSIKITSLTQNQTVPANEPLKISGVSSDNANTDCIVYADWNDLEPMQKANASGPQGIRDYSNWSFTYTSKYHLITEGTNELTSKLDCGSSSSGGGGGSSVKYYTVNVTGIPPQPQILNETTGNQAEAEAESDARSSLLSSNTKLSTDVSSLPSTSTLNDRNVNDDDDDSNSNEDDSTSISNIEEIRKELEELKKIIEDEDKEEDKEKDKEEDKEKGNEGKGKKEGPKK